MTILFWFCGVTFTVGYLDYVEEYNVSDETRPPWWVIAFVWPLVLGRVLAEIAWRR